MVISLKVKNEVLERDDFTCQKCGFRDASGKDLEIHHLNPKIFNGNEELQNLSILCSICHKHAPDNEKEFSDYISDKIDTKILDTFRKSNYSISKKTKAGMSETFKKGGHITKAPRGYRLVNKKLVINESEAEQVKTIFSEFLNNNISLTQLAKKYDMTTSGIKKLLKNTTYLGKVKYAGHESQGKHESIISPNLFKNVQEKL